jgi:hypothetical protein
LEDDNVLDVVVRSVCGLQSQIRRIVGVKGESSCLSLVVALFDTTIRDVAGLQTLQLWHFKKNKGILNAHIILRKGLDQCGSPYRYEREGLGNSVNGGSPLFENLSRFLGEQIGFFHDLWKIVVSFHDFWRIYRLFSRRLLGSTSSIV